MKIIELGRRMSFEQWWAETSKNLELHPDINHPSNRDYDYIAAYYDGAPVFNMGEELPSKYKGELHNKRYISFNEQGGDYFDSKLGREVGMQDVIMQDVRREAAKDNFLDIED